MKPTKWFLGGDPGSNGGLAAISANRGRVRTLSFSGTGVGEVEISEWFYQFNISHCIYLLEEVNPYRQGRKSAFTFGRNYERIWAIPAAYDFPRDRVRPQVWQSGMGIPKRNKKKESETQFKERLRRKAQQLFPRLIIWQGTLGLQRSVCDALLIAEYCRRRELGKLR
jgi:hypothetical protein